MGVVESDTFGSDFEGSHSTSEEGEVSKVGVAYGEVVTDGDVVVAKVFVEHGVHVVKAILWVLVFIELSHDNASDVWQQATDLDVVEHTIHLAHALTCILHKQDDARQQQWVEVGACQVVEDREVTTHDDALCPTIDIERMRCHMVFR